MNTDSTPLPPPPGVPTDLAPRTGPPPPHDPLEAILVRMEGKLDEALKLRDRIVTLERRMDAIAPEHHANGHASG